MREGFMCVTIEIASQYLPKKMIFEFGNEILSPFKGIVNKNVYHYFNYCTFFAGSPLAPENKNKSSLSFREREIM